MKKLEPVGNTVIFANSSVQVLNENASKEQRELFTFLYNLILDMCEYSIGIEMVKGGLSKDFQDMRKETELSKKKYREEKKTFGEYEIETSGRKRVIKVLGWEVSLLHNSIIKSTCPHLTVMMIDCIKDLNSDRYKSVKEELLSAIENH